MYERILVPIDGSPTSARGLDEAIRMAKLTHATLRLIHIVDPIAYAGGFETVATFLNDVLPRMRNDGERILAQGSVQASDAGVTAETDLHESYGARTCDVVIDSALAWGADLIVIGTHGRRGATRLLLGSDAEQILRLASVPVLLVRSDEAAHTHASTERGASEAALETGSKTAVDAGGMAAVASVFERA